VSDAWHEVAAWLTARADRAIETSCAEVYLGGDHAWKIKRPVNYGYLDFSTLEKREQAIRRELELNRRYSGDLYRAVRRVTRETNGQLAIDGSGEAIEWLLEMHRFDPAAVLSERSYAIDASLAEEIGRLLGRMHLAAKVAGENDLGAYGYTVDSNVEPLRRACPPFERDKVERIISATQASRAAIAPLLEQRRREGFFRECHGDLHLGNLLLADGKPTPFDCIEFSDVLARMDVAYDAAFTLMDLVVRGRPEAASRVLNAWLDETARGFPPSLWDGLAALPQFLCIRACIRAHVTAAQGDADGAQKYLAAAEAFLTPPAIKLTAIGGRSGTGKTWRAARLAGETPPGAVVLRTDLIRKRLCNVQPLERLPDAAYTPEVDENVYAEMFAAAGRVLATGWPVILDAVFLDPVRRGHAEVVAERCNVPFDGIWLEAPAALLRARVAARKGDASDADLAVLERQLARDAGPVTWRVQSLQSDD
jgi:aminoglycoside phosphotransferase family enzyme/predicted kinase